VPCRKEIGGLQENPFGTGMPARGRARSHWKNDNLEGFETVPDVSLRKSCNLTLPSMREGRIGRFRRDRKEAASGGPAGRQGLRPTSHEDLVEW
jgi:hypothetical protein